MALDFKAEKVDGKYIIKAIPERKGNNLIMHVPSIPLLKKLKAKAEKEDKIKEIKIKE